MCIPASEKDTRLVSRAVRDSRSFARSAAASHVPLPSSASSFRTAIAYAERAPPKAPSKTAWQIRFAQVW